MRMNAKHQSIPKGIIMLWYGLFAVIPDGWTHCNGNNDTPDLRNKFVVGTGPSYAQGETGGSLSHGHLFSGSPHSHGIPAGTGLMGGTAISNTTSVATAGGTVVTGGVEPPYHSLFWIMKL